MPSEPEVLGSAPARAANGLPDVPCLVEGRWSAGAGAAVALIDKFTLRETGRIRCASLDDVARAVDLAVGAAKNGAPGPHGRGQVLDAAAAAVQARRARFVEAMRVEAGFPEADADGEIVRCVQTLRLCAEEARRFAGQLVPMEGAPNQDGRFGFTLRVPLGVVCAITPFNAPLNGLAHKIGPAFAAGNAVIVKPSLFTPLTANLLAEAFLEAGMPPAFLAVLHGGADVGQWLVADERIAFYAFTGSTAAGRAIQSRIGLRRSQMELGSIAHTLLDEGCDLARALPKVANAAYRKAGQVCTSIQTLLVHRTVWDAAVAGLSKQVAGLRYGDPAQAGCVAGPLVSLDAAKRVEAWIEEAVAQGAARLAGGPRQAAVIPPTLLTDTSAEMKVRSHEVFGPVLSMVPFDDFDAALALVNSTPFGLSAGIFTPSLERAFKAARTLRSGAVHINETSSSRADLMPFGGSKESGFGREGPSFAIREMSEERLVTVIPG